MTDPLARNLRSSREEFNLSLDKLSEQTGVSKSMLRQIETGQSSPTVAKLWQIANGLHLPFTALLQQPTTDVVIQRFDAPKPILGDTDGYRLYPLIPFEPDIAFEMYYVEIDPDVQMSAEPHNGRPTEFVFVTSGAIDIAVDMHDYIVDSGTYISFPADQPHNYCNSGSATATALMLIAYRI